MTGYVRCSTAQKAVLGMRARSWSCADLKESKTGSSLLEVSAVVIRINYLVISSPSFDPTCSDDNT